MVFFGNDVSNFCIFTSNYRVHPLGPTVSGCFFGTNWNTWYQSHLQNVDSFVFVFKTQWMHPHYSFGHLEWICQGKNTCSEQIVLDAKDGHCTRGLSCVRVVWNWMSLCKMFILDGFGWLFFHFSNLLMVCGSDVWARTAIRLNTMGVELKCGWELGTRSVTVALLRMKRKLTVPWCFYHVVDSVRNFKNHDE